MAGALERRRVASSHRQSCALTMKVGGGVHVSGVVCAFFSVSF